ncbi:uncharacterized protein [Anabrus simplex]|uniref:uncharacterized protein n=1 Tax=Anabrus simplex TaxID=316456 RepID=UPI0035A2948E
MEEPVFVKCEPALSSDTEEPSNFEHSQLVSEMIPLKQETKSELTEPGPTQENAFEPSADIKEEMLIEQHQPVPNIKEGNNSKQLTRKWGLSGQDLQMVDTCAARSPPALLLASLAASANSSVRKFQVI